MRQFASDQEIADYVCRKTRIVLGREHTQLGIRQRDKVVAGCVFTNFSGSDISVTVAAEHPHAFTKTFLTRVGVYLWEELRVSRVTILTEQPRVVRIAQRLGAKIEGIKRAAFGPGRDATMLGLLASEWPFRTKRSGSDPLPKQA